MEFAFLLSSIFILHRDEEVAPSWWFAAIIPLRLLWLPTWTQVLHSWVSPLSDMSVRPQQRVRGASRDLCSGAVLQGLAFSPCRAGIIVIPSLFWVKFQGFTTSEKKETLMIPSHLWNVLGYVIVRLLIKL